jgi:DeoR family transcriptional regulator, aga operon transcriptional repressor
MHGQGRDKQDGSTPYARPRHRVERLRAILNLIDTDSASAVDDLAEALSVSSSTVRRDLAQLASQGLVLRSHGGAVRVERGYELPIRYRETSQAAEKRRIGQAAAEMVSDDAVVGLTGGTTTMEISRALAPRRLTVVTNALNIGAELALRPNIRLVMTGGIARSASFELSGPPAERAFQDYNIDIGFIGVDGVDPRSGCTAHNDSEAMTNAALVQRAARVIVVADHTKLAQVKFAKICDLSAVDLLLTDSGASEEIVAAFTKAGVSVRLA